MPLTRSVPLRSLWLALALCALHPGSGLRPAAAQASTAASESTVKAAFLYKFGDFVEWPTGT